MAVYVDELRQWGPRRRVTCHLTADSLDELRAFVAQVGVPRCYWHDGSRPHYDLPAKWRAIALEAGAEFVPAKVQAAARRGLR